MRAYCSVFSARFRVLLQYRAAAIAGFATQIFWGLIRVMIFDAFYRSTTVKQPMTYPEVVTYVWLGQGMLLLVIFAADDDISTMIRTGSVSYELVRPLDVYLFWYCRALAFRTAPLLLRSIPLFLIAGLFFNLQAPASFIHAGVFALSCLTAILLSSAMAMVMTISLLWTVSGDGVNRILPAAVFFFSGLIVPLPLLPDWMQSVVSFLPFRGLADTPYRIYMGHMPLSEVPLSLLHQWIWVVATVIFGYQLLNRGIRKLVVQGG